MSYPDGMDNGRDLGAEKSLEPKSIDHTQEEDIKTNNAYPDGMDNGRDLGAEKSFEPKSIDHTQEEETN